MKRTLWLGILCSLAVAGLARASEGVFSLDPMGAGSMRVSGRNIGVQYINTAVADTNGIHVAWTTSPDSAVARFPSTTESNLLHSAEHPFGCTVDLRISGTDANINAGTATLYGKNCLGAAITQDYTIVENQEATIAGTKAFYSIRKLVVNQQDGANVVVNLGFGGELGLPFTSPINSVMAAWADGTRETTAPTVTFDRTDIELNTVKFNTAFNGARDWVVQMWIPPYGAITSAGVRW